MPDVKISALPAATTAEAIDLAGVQSGVTKKLPSSLLATQAELDAHLHTGTYVRVNEGPLSLLDSRVNATTDNTGDNSAAFTTAVGLLPTNGGAIYAPPGDYRYLSTFDIPTLTKPGFILSGAGYATRFRFATANGTPAMKTLGGHATDERELPVLRDFVLQGPGASSGNGLEIELMGRFSVERVHFREFAGGAGIRIRDSLRTYLQQIVSQDNSVGMLIANSTGAITTNTVVEAVACMLRENSGDGLRIEEVETLEWWGGNIESNSGYGVHIIPPSGALLYDPTFRSTWLENNTSGGFRFDVTNGTIFRPKLDKVRLGTQTSPLTAAGGNSVSRGVLDSLAWQSAALTLPSQFADTVVIAGQFSSFTDSGARTIRLEAGEVRAATAIKQGGTATSAAANIDAAGGQFLVDGAGLVQSGVGTLANPNYAAVADPDTGVLLESNRVRLIGGANEQLRATEPADGEVGIFVRRNVGGTLSLQRVTMGAADSGGTGFKVLRVAN